MASSAKVTITLGRSGQVVQRRTISDIGIDDELPVSGRKRPVRERLGNTVVDSDSYGSQQGNKRRQTESSSLQIGDDGLVRQIGRHDLRLKLMRKGLSKKSNSETEQNGVDLREKLSRNSKNLQGYEARGRVPESRSSYDVREVPESGSGQSSKCSKRLDPPKKCSKRHVSSKECPKRHVSSKKRHVSPKKCSKRHVSPKKCSKRLVSPKKRSKRLVSSKKCSKRHISPKKCSKRHVSPKNTEVPLTVTGLLNSLGLEKYVCLFQGEEVDMTALSQMKDGDLKDMGVPMGPRKKILQAAAPYAKQWQRCPMI
ncbi:hypothetical protein ACQ4PT_013001 [Festuca glaucescens]